MHHRGTHGHLQSQILPLKMGIIFLPFRWNNKKSINRKVVKGMATLGTRPCHSSQEKNSLIHYYITTTTDSLLCPPQVRPHGTTPYCSDLLTDGGCVALLVVGFLLVTPLLVLALAAYCRLARHLQLGLCFIPYSRAVYKNLPASHHRGLGTGCCGSRDAADGSGKGKVWV